MSESEKIQSLFDSLKDQVRLEVFKRWNNQEFYQLIYLLLKEACEKAVKDFPNQNLNYLRQQVFSSMELLIEYSADAIQELLRQTKQVDLTRHGQTLHFRLT